jgi:hypothetical protein
MVSNPTNQTNSKEQIPKEWNTQKIVLEVIWTKRASSNFKVLRTTEFKGSSIQKTGLLFCFQFPFCKSISPVKIASILFVTKKN